MDLQTKLNRTALSNTSASTEDMFKDRTRRQIVEQHDFGPSVQPLSTALTVSQLGGHRDQRKRKTQNRVHESFHTNQTSALEELD